MALSAALKVCELVVGDAEDDEDDFDVEGASDELELDADEVVELVAPGLLFVSVVISTTEVPDVFPAEAADNKANAEIQCMRMISASTYQSNAPLVCEKEYAKEYPAGSKLK